jgi:phosphatase NudJ
MGWRVTVAAVIERQGRFLFVEERDGEGPRVLNQPAGHVEPGESLLAAVIREVAEETGLPFEPEAFLGVYQLRAPNGLDYLRLCFIGSVPAGVDPAPRDPDILACHWLTPEAASQWVLRSPLVARCLADHLAGQRLPLAAATAFVDARP